MPERKHPFFAGGVPLVGQSLCQLVYPVYCFKCVSKVLGWYLIVNILKQQLSSSPVKTQVYLLVDVAADRSCENKACNPGNHCSCQPEDLISYQIISSSLILNFSASILQSFDETSCCLVQAFLYFMIARATLPSTLSRATKKPCLEQQQKTLSISTIKKPCLE